MSICNLYKAYEPGKSSFYTFSEYTNDLALVVSNSAMTTVEPSSFICLTLKDTTDIHKVLQDYDNITCAYRDMSEGPRGAYYLGALMQCLGDRVDSSEKVCVASTSILSDEVVDGMTYEEFICYLSPGDSFRYSLEPSDNSIVFESKSDYLLGYEGRGDDYTFGKSDLTSIQEWNIIDNGEDTADEHSFNCIIVMYTKKISDTETEYLPLGIYIADHDIVKYNSSDAIYSQGSSYALRICTRFASTIDGSEFSTNIGGIDSYGSFLSALDGMTNVIEEAKNITSTFNNYCNALREVSPVTFPTDFTDYVRSDEFHEKYVSQFDSLVKALKLLEQSTQGLEDTLKVYTDSKIQELNDETITPLAETVDINKDEADEAIIALGSKIDAVKETDIKNLDTKIDAVNITLSGKIDGVAGTVTTLSNNLTTVNNRVSENQTAIGDKVSTSVFNDRCSGIDTEVDKLKTDLEGLGSQFETFSSDMLTKHSDVKRETSDLYGLISALTNRIDIIESKLTD